MADSLYDDDILLWSERQAEIIRALRDRRQDLPNDFDPENVAEEIESVGRSELASVGSFIENILRHVVLLWLNADPDAVPHWEDEIYSFGSDLDRRYSPSMRQRIDLQAEWRRAVGRVRRKYPAHGAALDRLPAACPFQLEAFLGGEVDGRSLAQALAASIEEAQEDDGS